MIPPVPTLQNRRDNGKIANLRGKFPQPEVLAAKVLPCHAPGNAFHENVRKTNAALDALKFDRDPKVHLIDLWSDFRKFFCC